MEQKNIYISKFTKDKYFTAPHFSSQQKMFHLPIWSQVFKASDKFKTSQQILTHWIGRPTKMSAHTSSFVGIFNWNSEKEFPSQQNKERVWNDILEL